MSSTELTADRAVLTIGGQTIPVVNVNVTRNDEGPWDETISSQQAALTQALNNMFGETVAAPDPIENFRVMMESRLVQSYAIGTTTGYQIFPATLSEEERRERVRPPLSFTYDDVWAQYRGTNPAVLAEEEQPRDPNAPLTESERTLYIKQLCAQTGTIFEQLNLELYKECRIKTDVNKVFFRGEEVKAPEKQELDVDTAERLNYLYKSCNPLGDLKRQAIRLRRQRDVAHEEYERISAEMCNISRRLKLSELHDDNFLLDGLRKVIAKGLWKFSKFSVADTIELILANNCILSWKDEDKGVDMTIDLGKLKLQYAPRGNNIKVLRGENNKDVEGYFHPHVSESGNVCWGNAAERIKLARETYDIEKIADTAFLLLHEYNDESPYATLTEFKEAEGFVFVKFIKVFDDYISESSSDYEHDWYNYDAPDGEEKSWDTVTLPLHKNQDNGELVLRVNGDWLDFESIWEVKEDPFENIYPCGYDPRDHQEPAEEEAEDVDFDEEEDSET